MLAAGHDVVGRASKRATSTLPFSQSAPTLRSVRCVVRRHRRRPSAAVQPVIGHATTPAAPASMARTTRVLCPRIVIGFGGMGRNVNRRCACAVVGESVLGLPRWVSRVVGRESARLVGTARAVLIEDESLPLLDACGQLGVRSPKDGCSPRAVRLLNRARLRAPTRLVVTRAARSPIGPSHGRRARAADRDGGPTRSADGASQCVFCTPGMCWPSRPRDQGCEVADSAAVYRPSPHSALHRWQTIVEAFDWRHRRGRCDRRADSSPPRSRGDQGTRAAVGPLLPRPPGFAADTAPPPATRWWDPHGARRLVCGETWPSPARRPAVPVPPHHVESAPPLDLPPATVTTLRRAGSAHLETDSVGCAPARAGFPWPTAAPRRELPVAPGGGAGSPTSRLPLACSWLGDSVRLGQAPPIAAASGPTARASCAWCAAGQRCGTPRLLLVSLWRGGRTWSATAAHSLAPAGEARAAPAARRRPPCGHRREHGWATVMRRFGSTSASGFGEILYTTVLLSYCSARHRRRRVTSEASPCPVTGEVLDLTVRSFGLLRRRHAPVEVTIERPTVPVNGSDRVSPPSPPCVALPWLPHHWPRRRPASLSCMRMACPADRIRHATPSVPTRRSSVPVTSSGCRPYRLKDAHHVCGISRRLGQGSRTASHLESEGAVEPCERPASSPHSRLRPMNAFRECSRATTRPFPVSSPSSRAVFRDRFLVYLPPPAEGRCLPRPGIGDSPGSRHHRVVLLVAHPVGFSCRGVIAASSAQ